MDKIKYTRQQLDCLEERFALAEYADAGEVKMLSDSLGVSVKQIRVWFQNRRAKKRRDELRAQNRLSRMDTSLRASRDSLTSGGATSRSSSRSPGPHASLAPSSPVSSATRSPIHMPTSELSVSPYDTASTSYGCSSYEKSPQWSHTSTSVSPVTPNRLSSPPNTGTGVVSPMPDTKFCQEFFSVPTVVVDQHEDLNLFFDENACDPYDLDLQHSTDCNRRNGEATFFDLQVGAYQQQQQEQHPSENLSAYANDYICSNHRQCQADTGTPSHDYNQATEDINYGAYSSSPTPARSHALTSLLMQEAYMQRSGQAAEVTTQYASSVGVNGDAAFVESLVQYLNE